MKKIRYAVVGAGWISQEAFMPGVHGTGNSEITAIVTGNPETGAKLAEFHGAGHVCGYEDYDAMLASGVADAVYIALPNSMHADYAIRAARAKLHVLVEKPMALTEAECAAMNEAAREAGVQILTAYRLHNEPATLAVLEMIREGRIGTPRIFSSVFTMQADPGNHRLRAEHWGGPLQDIGVYSLNAARMVFGAEPEVAAALTASADGDARFSEVEEVIGATLRFPGGAMAQFTASFGAEPVNAYSVIGTRGRIDVDPGFVFDKPLCVRLSAGGETLEETYPQTDHFAGMTAYFSDCILTGAAAESDGEEGLADVRAMRAIEEAARTGRAVPIESPPRRLRPGPGTRRSIPVTERRLLI